MRLLRTRQRQVKSGVIFRVSYQGKMVQILFLTANIIQRTLSAYQILNDNAYTFPVRCIKFKGKVA